MAGERSLAWISAGPTPRPSGRAFLRKLARRGLRGLKLVVSDAHEGIKSAVSKVFTASWQRCRVHFMRNALAHAGRSGRRVVSAFIATASPRMMPSRPARSGGASRTSSTQGPKLAAPMDHAETDVLALSFPPSIAPGCTV